MKSLAAIVVLASALPLFAQEPPRFGENVEVNAVLIDTIVTDSKGNQILGLDKNDFVVKEKGVEQPLDSVAYLTNRQLLNAPEEKAPFQVERTSESRYFIFFFDKPADGQLFAEVAQARSAAREFIDHVMRPGDLVAIAGHDIRLKIYSDFTSEKQQLRAALDTSASFGRGLTSVPAGSGPSIIRTIGTEEMINNTGTVYEAIDRLADGLRPIHARKELILFSAGILEPGDTVQNGVVTSRSQYYDPMVRSLNASNVTVYALNLLRGEAPETPAFHQTLEAMTSDTNGDYYRHAINLTAVVKQIEKQNNGYYLLSFTTHHPRGARGFQKVEVAVRNHPEMRVRARDGYTYGE
ncbi:MAG: von Willebrand factor, type [Acidobacteria bacterium]|nr:von Willebrand factor, type [Acidobacteriota bacterium]